MKAQAIKAVEAKNPKGKHSCGKNKTFLFQ
jgi:hypothetical protein